LDSSTHLQILPLALIMVMGPQILTAIFLVTSRKPMPNSVAMLIGVVLAASASLAIWYGLVKLIGVDPKEGGGPTTVDYVVAGLLALLAIHVYRGRGTAELPKWMSALQEAEPKRAFSLGFLLILLMPTDIVAVISTVNFLHDNDKDIWEGWPLIGATVLLMALPILAYTLLGDRAKRAMPGIREWLTGHGWLVNLIVIVYFIYQSLS
jgi:threonine/homoserine/homoserine lactone efflux protein